MVTPCLNSISEKSTQNLLECFVNLFIMASLTLVLAWVLAATAQAQEVPVKGVCFLGHAYNYLPGTLWGHLLVSWGFFCLFFNLSFRNSCLSWRQRQENHTTSLWSACYTWWVPGEPELYSKMLSQKTSTSNCLIDIINIKVICPLKKSFWAREMAP